MWVIFDVIILAIFIFAIINAYKDGFVKTLIKMGGKLIAIIAAYILASPFAQYIDKIFIKPALTSALQKTLVSNGLDLSSGEKFEQIVNEAPNFLNNILTKFNTTIDTVVKSVSQGSADYANQFIDATVSPISRTISFAIAFLVLFLAFSIVISAIAKVAGVVNKIPIIGGINRSLGFLLGFINGLITIFIFVFIASYALPLLETVTKLPIDAKSLDNTILYKHFEVYNPINLFFR